MVDNLSSGSLANLAEARSNPGHQLTFHQLDIRSPDVVELIARRRPEVVFHLAAQADVRVSVARPVFDAEVNILGSLQVLEGARAAGTRKVVFASSGGTIYGDPDPSELPVKESHPQRPVSPYGVAKKVVGDYLSAYRELHSLEYTALALANVYGPRQDPHGEAGVVAIFAGRLLAGQPCTIFGDGDQTRDFVYVDDVVDAFARAADRGSGLVINIGTGRETSVNDLYDTMAARGRGHPAAGLRPGPARRAAPQRPRPGPGRHPPGLEAVDDPGRGTGAVLDYFGPSADPNRSDRRPVARWAGPAGRGREAAGGQRNRSSAYVRTISSATDDSRSQAAVDPPDDGDGNAAGLAHDQLGGRGQLVGDADLGDLQLPARGVGGAPQVDDRGHAGAADGHVGDASAPGPAEGVGDDHADARRRRGPAGRRGCAGPSGRSRRAAGRPSPARRWTGRRRRWRRRSRGGSRS